MACCHRRRYRVNPVACKSPTPPKGVQPISGFDASRYLGKWYEVARRRIASSEAEQVTATYGARSDGGISVVNRGYDPVKNAGMRATGKPISPAPHHCGAEGVVLRAVLRRL